MPSIRTSAKLLHPLAWVWEPFAQEESFMLRPMFGARSLYLRGKIQLCCTAGQEPWAGVLVCTEKEHHAALLQDFPALVPHPVLGKWLYLSSSHPRFEGIVHDLIRCIKEADARIGVLPQPKKRRSVFSKDNHP